MSRIPKWKVEKIKVKVVFRLQFHATHIPQPGWDKLFVSFIPADSGKVTAKTTKANVRNGVCKWSDPIYETTRLLQDSTTKIYDEKLYKLVVAMGSSRSNLLGEVTINLADYLDALKPSSVDLPLHGCDFGTVLHVTIQLLNSKTGFREFEKQRELSEKGFHMISGQRRRDANKSLAVSESASEHLDKVNTKVRFKAESGEFFSPEEMGPLNEGHEELATGIDDSSNTSGSLYAEKNDTSTHEIDSLKSATSGDLGGFSLVQNPQLEKGETRVNRLSGQGCNDWAHGWSSDYSMDNDLASAYEENNRLRLKLEIAESTISQLKLETNSLHTLADKLGAETQSLAEQFSSELASGKELKREVSILQSECSKFKSDLEEVKIAETVEHLTGKRTNLPVMTKHNQAVPRFIAKSEDNNLAPDACQNKSLQGLMVIEAKVREIQRKACNNNYGSDIEDLYSDFNVLNLAVDNLRQSITQENSLGTVGGIQTTSISQPEVMIQDEYMEGYYRDHHGPQGMLPSSSGSDQVIYGHEALKKTSTTILEEKICDLLNELEMSRSEKENLTRKMDQMECYYEALIQQLEESQKQTQNDMENLKIEHGNCLYKIASLEGQIEKMHKEMNEQYVRFTEDQLSLDSLNKMLEKRAIASETALKRVRWNYSNAVGRLQKDLELLSFQVLSMYEANETLAKQAFTDASELYSQYCVEGPMEETKVHLCRDASWASSHQENDKLSSQIKSETLCMKAENESSPRLNVFEEKVNYTALRDLNIVEENKGMFETRDFRNAHVNGLKLEKIDHLAVEPHVIEEAKDLVVHADRADPNNRISDDTVKLEEMKLSLHMLKELYSRTEAELSDMHVLNMHWEIYTGILHEILHDVNDERCHMKNKLGQLSEQLEHSTKLKESLMHQLQYACDEAGELKENEAKNISRCNDLTLKIHILEEKLQGVSDENTSLTQKASEYEKLTLDYGVCESNYKICDEERMELAAMLKQVSVQKDCLQNEIGSVIDDYKALQKEFNNQSLVKVDLQKTVAYLEEKLWDLYYSMLSFNEKINEPLLDGMHLQEDLETKNYMAIVLNMEQFQQELYKRILNLLSKNKAIEKERDTAQCSLEYTQSQILFMEQKFKSDLEDLSSKLNVSTLLVEKRELELQDAKEKLMVSFEAEEINTTKSRELSVKLIDLENKLQHAANENKDLVEKLLAYGNVREELEKTKLSLLNCMQENKTLMMSVQSKNELYIKIENELSSLKETLRCVNDELKLEKGFRQEFEVAVADLSSQLKEKGCQLLSFDEQKAELVNLRERVSDLEAQTSELQLLLSLNEECQSKLNDKTESLRLQVADLTSQLTSAFQDMLVADVEATYIRTQLPSTIQALCDQLSISEKNHSDLHCKHEDVVSLLNKSKDNEAQLSKALESVKTELEITVSERNNLNVCINKNDAMWTEVEYSKARATTVEAENAREKHRFEEEICQLKKMLVSFEDETDILKSSRDELEITNMILKVKLDEQQNRILFLEECDAELRKLREKYNELNYKLSEQTLKTEEFKNLSVHLRELKDKAEAERHRAREKKESEVSSLTMQESLRIAFIKEQCETKVQELKNQLYASKKHSEEMLLKLQNALNEAESGRKSEISLAKRNDELSMKVSDLENELQAVVNDRRELVRAYDIMKAELECTILSLDCFKEEKLKLEASLQECNEEKTKIRVELDLVKRLLGNMASIANISVRRNHEPGTLNATSIGKILEVDNSEISDVNEKGSSTRDICGAREAVIGEVVDPASNADGHKPSTSMSNSGDEVEDSKLVPYENSCPSIQQNSETLQSTVSGTSFSEAFKGSGSNHISEIKEHKKEQERLKVEMDKLYDELERLKNDNLTSLLPEEDHHLDLALQGLERELTQLEKANIHLGSLFPSFKEFSSSGNALERVLALELELADALQVKNKPTIRFQSSFLKQHHDEAAVFQSFRDINELIKDMLELKKRNTNVETELKEMHNRYSQLSLQFAEVEGERQKLLMTLKNRTPKKSVL